jgi:hypothetical protein
MIAINDVQAALITRLSALIAAGTITPAGMVVQEFNAQSRSYTYPCLRIRVGPISLEQNNGECQPVIASFEVIAYSEQPSSLQASQIIGSVMRALNNKRLAVGSVNSSPIRVLQPTSPVPISDRGWAEHMLAECEIPSTWY